MMFSNLWWVRSRGASASSEVPLRRCASSEVPLRRCLFGGETLQL